MTRLHMEALAIAGTSASGKTVTVSSVSARTTLPLNAASSRARVVRLTATTATFVRPGTSTVTASSTGILLQSGDDLILSLKPFSYLAYVRESSGGKLNIYAVEF